MSHVLLCVLGCCSYCW